MLFLFLACVRFTEVHNALVEKIIRGENDCIREIRADVLVLRLNSTTDFLAAIGDASLLILTELLSGRKKILLDLCNVRRDDQVNVDSLVDISEAVADAGGVLRFANAPLEFAQAFRASLRYDFSMFDSVEEALRAFSV